MSSVPSPSPQPAPEPGPPQLLVSAKTAAPMLNISLRLLNELVRAGEIPSVRIRKRRLFDVDALRAWVRAHSEGGCP